MFKKELSEKIKEAKTIIGHSIHVKGDFVGDGDVVIEGSVNGTIKTSNFLYIGDQSKIVADIEAGDIKISGEITGNIKINSYAEITKTAIINGNISTSEISIEKGAKINGNVHMNGKPAIE